MKIILTILVLVSLLCENWSYSLKSTWQVKRLFCHWEETPEQFDATVYSTCLWRTWSIFNNDGSVNQENVSNFLSVQFGKMRDYETIRDGFQRCLNEGLGQNQAERSYFLYKCLETAGLIGKMDQNSPPENSDESNAKDMRNYYEMVPN